MKFGLRNKNNHRPLAIAQVEASAISEVVLAAVFGDL